MPRANIQQLQPVPNVPPLRSVQVVPIVSRFKKRKLILREPRNARPTPLLALGFQGKEAVRSFRSRLYGHIQPHSSFAQRHRPGRREKVSGTFSAGEPGCKTRLQTIDGQCLGCSYRLAWIVIRGGRRRGDYGRLQTVLYRPSMSKRISRMSASISLCQRTF
jgi:hypothetical protein